MDNIVIFGGTFDPVHNGHLTIAEHAITDIKARECIWVPNKQPLLKNHAQASTKQRLDMLSLAIQQSHYHDNFKIDLCEINRDGPSYMIDTLRYFREQFGREQSLSLLMGEDAFTKLNQWYEWETIITLAHLIVVTRPNQAHTWPVTIKTLFDSHQCIDVMSLSKQSAGLIYLLKIELNISSTDIRQMLSQKSYLRHVCPAAVADYITQQNLYS